MQTQINLAAFIGDLSKPESVTEGVEETALGNSITNDRELMRMFFILAGKYSNGKPVNETELIIRNSALGFSVFILYCRHLLLYDLRMEKLDKLAAVLKITKDEQQDILAFLQNETPYSDKINAIYLNTDKNISSVKYIGVNIIHSSGKGNEILYLKYFERYNVFLSKTFVSVKDPYHFMEQIHSTEINIVNSSNYLLDNFAYHTFEEMVESVKSHHPFQYFELAPTANTPKIILDPRLGRVLISGSSSPFSPSKFFEPVLEWFQNFGELGPSELKVVIRLDYFNTYTSKFLLNLCRRCDSMVKEGKQIKIFWYFDPEDSDMKEFGEHLGSIFKKGIDYFLLNDGIEELV